MIIKLDYYFAKIETDYFIKNDIKKSPRSQNRTQLRIMNSVAITASPSVDRSIRNCGMRVVVLWYNREVRKCYVGKSQVGQFPLKLETTDRNKRVCIICSLKLSKFRSKLPTSFSNFQQKTFQLLYFSNYPFQPHGSQSCW